MGKAFCHCLIFLTVALAMSGCIDPRTMVHLPKNIISAAGDDSDTVIDVAIDDKLTNLELGYCFSRASDDVNFCWGNGSLQATELRYKTATAYLKNKTIKMYAAANSYSCAIASDDKAYCWGAGTDGKLGTGSDDESLIPLPVVTSGVLNGVVLKEIILEADYACAISTADKAYCWGQNTYGQLGNGTTVNSNVPVEVDTSGVLNGRTIKSMKLTQAGPCVVADDNKVYCWGANLRGALGNGTFVSSNTPVAVTMPGGLTAKTLESSTYVSCMIASDDLVYCWGFNLQANLGDGSGVDQNIPTAVDTSGVLSGKTVKSLVVHGHSSCVIANDDLPYCWGLNISGRLGNNSNTMAYSPVAVVVGGALSGLTVKSISMGDNGTTCAIASNDQLYCWGEGSQGELGNNTLNDSFVPVAVDTSGVLNGKIIKSVSMGYNHSCAIASDDEVYCWGYGYRGGLGNNSNQDSAVPVALVKKGNFIGKTSKLISAKNDSTCSLASDDTLYCWGAAYLGSGTGYPSNINLFYPVPVYADQLSNQFITDSIFSFVYDSGRECIQRPNGDVYCDNNDRNFLFSFSMGSVLIKKMSSSYDAFACFIGNDDKAYCLGETTLGYDSSGMGSHFPLAVHTAGVLNGLTIEDIQLGYYHACVLGSDKNVYCWGDDSAGALGNSGGFITSDQPVAVTTSGVLNGLIVKELFVKAENSCVKASDDNLYCWGSGQDGRLGNGASANSAEPVAVDTTGVLSGKTIKSLTMGESHNCAIASDDKAYCWGIGTEGALGQGSFNTSNTPVAVNTTATFKSLTIGYSFSCAVGSNNSVYCWGEGASGQLGNGSTSQSNIPVAVGGLLTGLAVGNVTASYETACAITSTSDVFCWGLGSSGELGNNATSNSSVPVALTYAP